MNKAKLHAILTKFLEKGVRSNVPEILIEKCIGEIEEVYKEEVIDEM